MTHPAQRDPDVLPDEPIGTLAEAKAALEQAAQLARTEPMMGAFDTSGTQEKMGRMARAVCITSAAALQAIANRIVLPPTEKAT